MCIMNDSNKKKRQLEILRELREAQQKDFISLIEIELAEDAAKIIYEPDWNMYRNNDLDHMVSVYPGDKLDETPSYVKLFVTFSVSVSKEHIDKISKYASKKYGCDFLVLGNRITFFGF